VLVNEPTSFIFSRAFGTYMAIPDAQVKLYFYSVLNQSVQCFKRWISWDQENDNKVAMIFF